MVKLSSDVAIGGMVAFLGASGVLVIALGDSWEDRALGALIVLACVVGFVLRLRTPLTWQDLIVLAVGGFFALMGMMMVATGPSWEIRLVGVGLVALFAGLVYGVRWEHRERRWGRMGR